MLTTWNRHGVSNPYTLFSPPPHVRISPPTRVNACREYYRRRASLNPHIVVERAHQFFQYFRAEDQGSNPGRIGIYVFFFYPRRAKRARALGSEQKFPRNGRASLRECRTERPGASKIYTGSENRGIGEMGWIFPCDRRMVYLC